MLDRLFTKITKMFSPSYLNTFETKLNITTLNSINLLLKTSVNIRKYTRQLPRIVDIIAHPSCDTCMTLCCVNMYNFAEN